MVLPTTDQNEAWRDRLTGLPGIDAVRGRLGQWLADAREGEAARVHGLLLGLRRFDAVNLAFGMPAGDGALAEIAARLTNFAADELDVPWLAARGSGDSFLLIAEGDMSRERWALFAHQLAEAISRSIAAPAGKMRLTPRVALLRGLAGETADSMLERLGQTLDVVLRQPGRRVAWADGEAVRPGLSAAQLEADLLGAIDRDEIDIVFQPQFALPSDQLSGAEALARWNHPRLGRVGAGALFTIAERADHVAPLSRHIAARALAKASECKGTLRLSLNVTAADLAADSYAKALLETLEESGFAAERLTLEVTEQALLSDVHLAARTLRTLSARGIRVALDDFGAGFCNFRYLKLLPLHYLKLDRSMVDGISSDSRDLAVLRGIIAMAGAIGLEVIAEGIETEDQRRVIAQEGCAFYQGFLRSPPVSAEEFGELARE